MTISMLGKGLAGALTASAITAAAAASAGATTLTLVDPPTQSDTVETVTFTATATELLVIDKGYQVNDLETLTDNSVTLWGGGPNLLGPTWQYRFAALGSNSYTFNDGSPVPALGFAAQDPPDVDTFYQFFATVPGKSYTYSSPARTTPRVSARRLRCLSPPPAAFRRPPPGPSCFSAS